MTLASPFLVRSFSALARGRAATALAVVALWGPAPSIAQAVSEPVPLGQHEGCYAYDGETASLRGRIELENFPGPPNFTSVHRGDEVVPEFVLVLDRPICVDAEDAVPADEDSEGQPAIPARSGVRRVQALMPKAQPIEAELLGRLGESVWLHGPLVPPSSKYHYLPVVIRTTRMVPVFLERPDALEIPTADDGRARSMPSVAPSEVGFPGNAGEDPELE